MSIDGGSIKGLYSSTILEHFEEKFNCQLSDYFDLLCGTSTGGLIALAASLKIPMGEVSKFYQEEGPKIFPKQSVLWLPAFSANEYHSVISNRFFIIVSFQMNHLEKH